MRMKGFLTSWAAGGVAALDLDPASRQAAAEG